MKNKFSDKKKHILQLNLNGTGGAFSLISSYAIALQDNYIFDFYCLGEFASSEKTETLNKLGSIVYEQKKYRNRFINYLIRPFCFYFFLKKNHYDIIHINSDLSYNMFLYSFPAILAGVKRIVLHSHSSNVNGDYRHLKKVFHNIFKFFLISKRYERISCSKLARNWMFFKHQNVSIIKNAISLEKFKFNSKARDFIRQSLGANGKKIILMVGDMSFAKNPEFILDVFSKIQNKEEYLLLFIGEGKNTNNVKKYAKNLNIEQFCFFAGQKNNVNEYYSAADLYVMPSRFEGMPVSAIEAQASGVPSLLSDNITSEVKFLDSCVFLSIDSEQIWVNEITNSKLEYNRYECNNRLKIIGYDIQDSAKELSKVYSI